MTQQLKDRWVKALRSGRYEQARGTLVAESGALCCLGVLAKISRKSLAEARVEAAYEFCEKELGVVVSLRCQELNDGDHRCRGALDFPAIADYIEANVEVSP